MRECLIDRIGYSVSQPICSMSNWHKILVRSGLASSLGKSVNGRKTTWEADRWQSAAWARACVICCRRSLPRLAAQELRRPASPTSGPVSAATHGPHGPGTGSRAPTHLCPPGPQNCNKTTTLKNLLSDKLVLTDTGLITCRWHLIV